MQKKQGFTRFALQMIAIIAVGLRVVTTINATSSMAITSDTALLVTSAGCLVIDALSMGMSLESRDFVSLVLNVALFLSDTYSLFIRINRI